MKLPPPPTHQETSPTNSSKVNLKKLKFQEIDPNEDSLLNKNSKNVLVPIILQQEAATLTRHRKKDKESKELEKIIDKHQCILIKSASSFSQKQDNISEDILKTSSHVDDILEKTLDTDTSVTE